MKRVLQTLTLAALCLTATAQKTGEFMILEQTDGTVQKFNVADVAKVFFEADPLDNLTVDINYFPTQKEVEGTWNAEYEGYDFRQRTNMSIKRTLSFTADGKYSNEMLAAIGKNTTFIVIEREFGTYAYDADNRVVTYNVITDSVLNFGSQKLEGYVKKHFPEYELPQYTEKVQFSNPFEGKRYWLTQDKTLVVSDMDRTPVNYVLSKDDGGAGPVIPDGPFMEEPYLGWGAMKDVVKAYMKDKGYQLKEEGFIGDSETLLYIGKMEMEYVGYIFEKDWNLAQTEIAFKKEKVPLERVKAEMEKKYTFITEAGGRHFYMSEDLSTTILAVWENESSGLVVVDYFSYAFFSKPDEEDFMEEPYLGWKSTHIQVKSVMSDRGYELKVDNTDVDGSRTLVYGGKYKMELVGYVFQEGWDLIQAEIAFNRENVTLDEAKAKIAQDYNFVATIEGIDFYISPDNSTTLVGVTENESIDMVIIDYFCYDYFMKDTSRTAALFDNNGQKPSAMAIPEEVVKRVASINR